MSPGLVTLVTTGVLLASPLAVHPQRLVTGRIVDPTGAPVPFVSVQLEGQRVVADDSGRFRIKAPASPVQLRFRRAGFRPGDIKLRAGGDTSIVVSLTSLPLELDRVIVAWQAAGRIRTNHWPSSAPPSRLVLERHPEAPGRPSVSRT